MKKILFTLFRQPITTVILSLLIAFGGVMGALGMPMQLVPDMKIPIVSVVVTYPGASAAVIEESVTSVSGRQHERHKRYNRQLYIFI